MEKEEQYSTMGRAELIKQARESCSQRLEGVSSKERIVLLKDRTIAAKLETSEANSVPWLKFFMIRFIVAIIIFLVIIAIDQFGINNSTINSNTIKQQISSNVTVDQLENYISEFAEDKVMPVLNH